MTLREKSIGKYYLCWEDGGRDVEISFGLYSNPADRFRSEKIEPSLGPGATIEDYVATLSLEDLQQLLPEKEEAPYVDPDLAELRNMDEMSDSTKAKLAAELQHASQFTILHTPDQRDMFNAGNTPDPKHQAAINMVLAIMVLLDVKVEDLQ